MINNFITQRLKLAYPRPYTNSTTQKADRQQWKKATQ
jgi:hypothetical protein